MCPILSKNTYTVTVLLFPSLFVDYRHFDAVSIMPRFEFGFGLSYAEFQYSGLDIAPVEGEQDQDGQLEANWQAAQPGPNGVGLSTALWLHRPAYTMSFAVQNAGQVAGTVIRSTGCYAREITPKRRTERVEPALEREGGSSGAVRPSHTSRVTSPLLIHNHTDADRSPLTTPGTASAARPANHAPPAHKQTPKSSLGQLHST